MKPFRSHGFSLIELMVAMSIGLFGILAVTQVYLVSEDQKRTTLTSGEAQQNGIIGLQLIQQDLLTAGYGIVSTGLGCVINAYNSAAIPMNYTLSLVPAVIRPDDPVTGTASITVMYSTASGISGPPAQITAPHNPSAANFQLDNTIGFSERDFIVAYQPGKPCTLMQTTNNPTLPASNTLVHNSGESNYNVAGNTNFPQRPPSGPYATAGYDAGSLMFNLGQLVNIRYQISGSKLVQVNIADGGNTTSELADGIVAIRAQYAIDADLPNPAVAATSAVANGDGVVDAYVDPRADGTPNHAAFGNANPTQIAAGWGRVYAIRIAMVARSSLREKAPVTDEIIPLWPDGASCPSSRCFTVPDRNYRYKVFHTVVPLRNMIWRRPGI